MVLMVSNLILRSKNPVSIKTRRFVRSNHFFRVRLNQIRDEQRARSACVGATSECHSDDVIPMQGVNCARYGVVSKWPAFSLAVDAVSLVAGPPSAGAKSAPARYANAIIARECNSRNNGN